MATPEQLAIARQKALLSPANGKHGKWGKTIEREKRREIFDEIVSQEFPDLIRQARPEYKLDQFLGKSPDEVKLSGEVKTGYSEELIAIAEAEWKRRKRSKTS